jgi:hypothetical protein
MARRLPSARASLNLVWALSLGIGLLCFGTASRTSAAPEDYESGQSWLEQGPPAPPEVQFPGDDDQPTRQGKRREHGSVAASTVSNNDPSPESVGGANHATVQSTRSSDAGHFALQMRMILRNWLTMIR